MKRQTSKGEGENPIVRVRRITGRSQRQFAVMLGVSLPLVKAIERGARPVTEAFARKLAVATGAVIGAFDYHTPAGRKSPVKTWKPFRKGWVLGVNPMHCEPGMEYSAKTFAHHQELFRADPEAALARLNDLLPKLQAMFIAAAKPGLAGARNRLPALVLDLQEWMSGANEQFRLGVR